MREIEEVSYKDKYEYALLVIMGLKGYIFDTLLECEKCGYEYDKKEFKVCIYCNDYICKSCLDEDEYICEKCCVKPYDFMELREL